MIVLMLFIKVAIACAVSLHWGYTVSWVRFVSTSPSIDEYTPLRTPFWSSKENHRLADELDPVAFTAEPVKGVLLSPATTLPSSMVVGLIILLMYKWNNEEVNNTERNKRNPPSIK